ncbi:MAG: hypothetical protein ABL309_10445 [Phycisphaerales bacterium]
MDIEDWILVPTMDGSRVSSFVCILPPTSVVANNVAIMWFQRDGDEDGDWRSYAWDTQDYSAAIQHVVDYYGIPLDQADWPVTVNPTTGTGPGQFGNGVFPNDPFADDIAESEDPDATVNALTMSGWQSSMLPAWLKAGCTKEEYLETISALVEADIASNSGGALAALLGTPGYQCGDWASDILILDSTGTTVIPNYGEITEYAAVPNGTTFWQSVAPGMSLTDPQTMTVSLGYTSAGVSTTTHNKVLAVLDVHAPDIVMTPNLSDAFRNVPSRLPFLVAPETISFSATGTDAVDGVVGVTMTLNGEPYAADAMIDQPGLHVVQVSATDSHGNLTEETIAFEIRDRETYETAVIVEDLQDYYSPTGELEQVVVTVLIASHGFEEKDLHLATLQASLLDETGSFVTFNAKPDGIGFSRQTDGTFVYDPLVVNIEIERGYMRVPFTIDTTGLGLMALPAEIMVSGSSSSARAAVPFEFMEVVSTEVSDDPENELDDLDLLDPSADPEMPPNFDPDRDCEWKFEWQLHNPGDCSDTDEDAQPCLNPNFFTFRDQNAWSYLVDPGGKPKGLGHAIDESCWGHAESDCAGTASVRLYIWLETAASGNQCEIALNATPSFTVRAWGEGLGARAKVGAHIHVSAGGQSSTATGGSEYGPEGGPGSIPVGPWEIPLPSTNRRGSPRPYSGVPIDYVFDSCALGVAVASGAYIEVFANGRLYFNIAQANITKATPGISIDAVVVDGPCDGKRRTEYYR